MDENLSTKSMLWKMMEGLHSVTFRQIEMISKDELLKTTQQIKQSSEMQLPQKVILTMQPNYTYAFV